MLQGYAPVAGLAAAATMAQFLGAADRGPVFGMATPTNRRMDGVSILASTDAAAREA
jgi:hypothetical protein